MGSYTPERSLWQHWPLKENWVTCVFPVQVCRQPYYRRVASPQKLFITPRAKEMCEGPLCSTREHHYGLMEVGTVVPIQDGKEGP